MTSNQKSVLEPVAKGKEFGETKYLIQQYLHLRICKKQKYIDINLVTILKRGQLTRQALETTMSRWKPTWNAAVSCQSHLDHRLEHFLATSSSCVPCEFIWDLYKLKTSDPHSNAPSYPVNPREISSFSSWRQVILFETSHFERGFKHVDDFSFLLCGAVFLFMICEENSARQTNHEASNKWFWRCFV